MHTRQSSAKADDCGYARTSVCEKTSWSNFSIKLYLHNNKNTNTARIFIWQKKLMKN